MRSSDLIVLGGGVIGAAAFAHLAEAGWRCVLLEAGRSGLAATGHSGAVIRVAHGSLEAAHLAAEGARGYEALERDSDGALRRDRFGHLLFGTMPTLEPVLEQLRRESVRAELLSGHDLRRRFERLRPNADAAIYEPDGGRLPPVATVQAFLAKGVRHGGVVMEAVAARRIRPASGGGVTVETTSGTFSASRALLAAGGETDQILSRSGLPLAGVAPQRIQVSRFTVEPAASAAGLPAFYDEASGLNGVPGQDLGGYHVGLATGLRGKDYAGASVADPAHAERTRSLAATRLGLLETAQFSGAMCHADGYGPHGVGLVGTLPDGPDALIVAAGFSGGGFKFAPAVANRIAVLAAEGRLD